MSCGVLSIIPEQLPAEDEQRCPSVSQAACPVATCSCPIRSSERETSTSCATLRRPAVADARILMQGGWFYLEKSYLAEGLMFIVSTPCAFM